MRVEVALSPASPEGTTSWMAESSLVPPMPGAEMTESRQSQGTNSRNDLRILASTEAKKTQKETKKIALFSVCCVACMHK